MEGHGHQPNETNSNDLSMKPKPINKPIVIKRTDSLFLSSHCTVSDDTNIPSAYKPLNDLSPPTSNFNILTDHTYVKPERDSSDHTVNLPACSSLNAITKSSDPEIDFLEAFADSPAESDDLGPIDNYLHDSVPSARTDSKLEEFDINPQLGLEIIDCIKTCILQNYIDVPSSKVKPLDYKMNIQVNEGAPFYSHPRRLAHAEGQEVRKMVKELLDKEIIRPSESPYASPIVLMKKKNGTTRMCVDYRALNKTTIRDNFPLPLIEDCLGYLNGKQYFSLLDLKSGFHHVRMADDSIKYTSFVTPDGQYEYIRMPFGLRNAPSVFQRYIYRALQKYIDAGKIVVCMDDLLLASDTLDEHITLLGEILRALAQLDLQLQPNKCQFAYQEIEYLGFRVTTSGIEPGSNKSKAISQFPTPANAKTVLSFLGLCSYFRRFICNFASIANPLYRLLRKDTPFAWDDKCSRAFETLKQALTSSPVLSIYDPSRETELHTDASRFIAKTARRQIPPSSLLL